MCGTIDGRIYSLVAALLVDQSRYRDASSKISKKGIAGSRKDGG